MAGAAHASEFLPDVGQRFERLVGVGSPDADDLSALKIGESADNGPAELSGGVVGENKQPVALAGLEGFGERRF